MIDKERQKLPERILVVLREFVWIANSGCYCSQKLFYAIRFGKNWDRGKNDERLRFSLCPGAKFERNRSRSLREVNALSKC